MRRASRMEYLTLGWVMVTAAWSCPFKILSSFIAVGCILCFLAMALTKED